MKFRTEITINNNDASKFLSPERLVLLAGSCFSDNIGSRMHASGWPAIINPCGVVYNPVSMALLFRLALTQRVIRREIAKSSLTLREGRYVSWFMGAKAMDSTAEGCLDKVYDALDHLEEGIEKAHAIILTFGTSDVWLLKGTDCAVGNCHKHPSGEFEKKRADIEEISETWKIIIEDIRLRNPEVKVILTVSPRRYLSDGFAENSRQKAVLILACEKLVKGVKDVFYFPSFEILNDDLRDYRFYSSDLLHPSETAIDYIWNKFTESYLNEKALLLLSNMEKEARRKAHRPIGEA